MHVNHLNPPGGEFFNAFNLQISTFYNLRSSYRWQQKCLSGFVLEFLAQKRAEFWSTFKFANNHFDPFPFLLEITALWNSLYHWVSIIILKVDQSDSYFDPFSNLPAATLIKFRFLLYWKWINQVLLPFSKWIKMVQHFHPISNWRKITLIHFAVFSELKKIISIIVHFENGSRWYFDPLSDNMKFPWIQLQIFFLLIKKL